MTDHEDDAQLARLLAEGAGRVLLDVRDSGLFGRDLARAGDASAHDYLVAALAGIHPDDIVLSEEGADPSTRLIADRVWIVDPLDGTREFSEPGRDDWAVHVALWERGDLVAGAVALPARNLCFATDGPPEVPPPAVARPDGVVRLDDVPLRLAVSRTRPPQLVHELVGRYGMTQVPMGSAGVKCAAVWSGDADAYVHAGGQYEWDSAAPVAVARAAGLFTSRVDGSPLRYNRPDPLLPDLVVCRAELAEPLIAALRGLTVTID